MPNAAGVVFFMFFVPLAWLISILGILVFTYRGSIGIRILWALAATVLPLAAIGLLVWSEKNGLGLAVKFSLAILSYGGSLFVWFVFIKITPSREMEWFLNQETCRKWTRQCSNCGAYGRDKNRPDKVLGARFDEVFPESTLMKWVAVRSVAIACVVISACQRQIDFTFPYVDKWRGHKVPTRWFLAFDFPSPVRRRVAQAGQGILTNMFEHVDA